MLLADGDGNLRCLPNLSAIEKDVFSFFDRRAQFRGSCVVSCDEVRQVARVVLGALDYPANQDLGHLKPEGCLRMAKLLHEDGVDQLFDDLVRELPSLQGLEARRHRHLLELLVFDGGMEFFLSTSVLAHRKPRYSFTSINSMFFRALGIARTILFTSTKLNFAITCILRLLLLSFKAEKLGVERRTLFRF